MSIIMSFNKTELETTTNSLIGETPNVTNIMARNEMGIVPKSSQHTSRKRAIN